MSSPVPEARIRVKAIAVIRRGDDVLVSFAIDPESGARYGRFLGGAIEPGECAAAALRRELREELGVELDQVQRLGVVENLFSSPYRQIHEVIFVFVATFVDRTLYERDTFPVDEAICDGPAAWVAMGRLRRGDILVYPPDLIELIDRSAGVQP